MIAVVIIAIIVGGGALWLWAMYNGLVKLNVRTDESWADIQVQLKRRYDLIPNLVDTVKGYATHEREVLTQVTEARNMAAGTTGDPKEQAQAENQFAGTLKTLFAVAESYPDLKANQNFLELQQELVDTEDKIQASRRFYNANARDMNIKVKMFPTKIFAKSLGFGERTYFEVDEAKVADPVKVSF
jgi:LemA protein